MIENGLVDYELAQLTKIQSCWKLKREAKLVLDVYRQNDWETSSSSIYRTAKVLGLK